MMEAIQGSMLFDLLESFALGFLHNFIALVMNIQPLLYVVINLLLT